MTLCLQPRGIQAILEDTAMLTKQVIKEIYKKYNKPPKNIEDLSLPRYIAMLQKHHDLQCVDGEIINHQIAPGDPFARILVKRMNAVLDFDRMVAFVFDNHIMFLDKYSDNIHVHFKPDKPGFFARIARLFRLFRPRS